MLLRLFAYSLSLDSSRNTNGCDRLRVNDMTSDETSRGIRRIATRIPEQEARERTKKEAARAKASPRLVAEVVAGIANTRSK